MIPQLPPAIVGAIPSATALIGWNNGIPGSFTVAQLGGGSNSAENIFYTAATDSSIREAYTAAAAAGGGYIVMPAAMITILSPLPLAANIKYVGCGCTGLNYTLANNDAGTILIGDGTFNCFEWHPSVSGSLPASSAAMFATSPVGVEFHEFKMRGFLNGMKFGAFQNVGLQAIVVNNVAAENCTGWGFWFENCQGMKIGNVSSFNNLLGQWHHSGSMGTLWYFGNDLILNLNCAVGAPGGIWTNTQLANMRGIVVTAVGAGAILNDILYVRAQHNGYAMSTITQAAATVFTSASAQISITGNIDRYQIDSALQFGTTSGGNTFVTQRPYFIVAKHDNGDGTGWVSVAAVKGGTAIAAVIGDAASSTTIITKGSALLELGGTGDTTSVGGVVPIVLNYRFLKTDLENGGSVNILMQNMQQGDIHLGLIGGSNGTVSLCANGISANNTIYSPALLQNVYFYGQFSFYGIKPLSFLTGTPTSQYSFRGSLLDTGVNNQLRLFMGGTNPNGKGDLSAYGSQVLPNLPIAAQVQEFVSGPNLATNYANEVIFTGLSNQNLSLPAPSSASVGNIWYFCNPTAFTLLLFSTGFLINGRTRTDGFAVRPHSMAVATVTSNSGVYGWSILSTTDALQVTATVNPGTVASGTPYTTVVAVAGAVFGDDVAVSCSVDTGGLFVSGRVSSAGNVTLSYICPTTASIVMGSHTATVTVKHTG